jgi:hypothetical protein
MTSTTWTVGSEGSEGPIEGRQIIWDVIGSANIRDDGKETHGLGR